MIAITIANPANSKRLGSEENTAKVKAMPTQPSATIPGIITVCIPGVLAFPIWRALVVDTGVGFSTVGWRVTAVFFTETVDPAFLRVLVFGIAHLPASCFAIFRCTTM
jgi:hypothetical protein